MYELREAFREAARREFAMVPAEEELDYIFSDRFERRMRRMIRAQAHGYWNLINTTAKRVAIAAAIILMLLSTAMAIKPIRERVIKFFVDVYEEYFEIHFGEEESWDLPERTEPMVRYTLTELPEGYEEIRFVDLGHLFWTEWNNDDDVKMTLLQEPGTQEITLDNSLGEVVSIEYEGIQLMYQESYNARCFIWKQDEYIFYLSVDETISMDEGFALVSSVKKIE